MRNRLTSSGAAQSAEVQFKAGDALLNGTLDLPADATAVVLFAHGSGSSRFSSRNRRVARQLQSAGLGTLLFDLLTPAEEGADAMTGHLRFDIAFLADRLRDATRWVRSQPGTRELPLGYFGASTGAAAALVAAATTPEFVMAIVSRGGRPDLAADQLANVRAATLLIVGGDDEPVIPLNRTAFDRLRGVKRFEIIPGATHLFEEPGALEAVAGLAAAWFCEHLAPPAPRPAGDLT